MKRRFARRHFPGALLVFAVSAAALGSLVAGAAAGATFRWRPVVRRPFDDIGPVIQ